MAITVEAIYENGTLRLATPLPFNDLEKVEVTVNRKTNWVQDTAGLIKWNGDHETLRRLAEDVEFDPQESA